MELKEKVRRTGFIQSGDKIIAGVSGGPDSVCMLSILAELAKEMQFELIVVHINHMLRDVADEEEEYVKNLSLQLGVPFFSKKADVHSLSKEWKLSCEEAARKVRYDFFYEILGKTGANKIAVAHNANDHVETMLLNLIRGSGLDGLCGIQRNNGEIIRPLLEISREEIEEYLKERKITARIDATNFEEVYTRNKIRNRLLPYLTELNPNILSTLYRTSEILNDVRCILREVTEKEYQQIKKATGILDKTRFLALSPELCREVLRLAIWEFHGNRKDISYENLQNAVRILENAQSGTVVELLKDLKIKVEYENICFLRELELRKSYEYELKVPGITMIPETGKKITAEIVSVNQVENVAFSKNKVVLDVAKTGKKLYVRNKRSGDFFYPTGMSGKKTLKKFFSDLKISEKERNEWPILTTEKEVVWIIGKRLSRKFLKEESTKEVIILDYGENI